jgi:hypothetical protein
MVYHTPDETWKVFGFHTYESYIQHYLIKGNFHNKVPQDILDAYTTVEYLIAHAYYYYPMYDEAFSKSLRIIEMAIKIRCAELKIELMHEVKVKGKPKIIKKDLKRLIHDLSKKEKGKDFDNSLNGLRELRNSNMHPDMNAFMGGMSRSVMIACVDTINLIFAD